MANFFEVVRRDVGRHPDRDARHPVHQQVGVLRGQDDRLFGGRGIVGPEVDGLLPKLAQERVRDRRQPALGVPHRRRRVAVDRAEIAVTVDQRLPQAERLRHPHECVVDRLVAVRVIGLHHLADNRRALDVAAVGRDVQVMPHRVQNPALHGLEPVAQVGQGARGDHREGVVQVARSSRLGEMARPRSCAAERAAISS